MRYLLLLFFSIQVFSQKTISKESLEELKNNFLTHRIKYFHSKDYNNLLPSKGWNLELIIEKTIDTFGLNKENWSYFIVRNNNFSYWKMEGKSKIIKESDFKDFTPTYYKLSRESLIALNEKNELICIGGNFFESYTVDHFSLESNDKIYNYLKAKLFNYKLDNIEFYKKTRKNLKFKAFSRALFSEIDIIIDKNNYDNVTVKINKNIIECGNRD
jgi:hypothetical protein